MRTIVSADNCQEDICQGGHLSKKKYFKTYHVGYRWKGLDFKIVNLQFFLMVCELKKENFKLSVNIQQSKFILTFFKGFYQNTILSLEVLLYVVC